MSCRPLWLMLNAQWPGAWQTLLYFPGLLFTCFQHKILAATFNTIYEMSHVFLLKVFMSRKHCVLYWLKWGCGSYLLHLFTSTYETKRWPLNCQTNHSVCLKPAAVKEKQMTNCKGGGCKDDLNYEPFKNCYASPIRQTISSHSLMMRALSTTQQKPVDERVSGESLWRKPMACLSHIRVQPITTEL